MDNNVAIEIKNLTKKYGEFTAVNSINCTINKGEIFAFLGVNGAGKTTTIKMLTGLASATSGDAVLLNKSILKDLNEIKSFVNISPQETSIAKNLSVKENLEFVASIYSVSDINTKVNEILDMFDLTSIKNKSSKQLSGGWQRRLSIAMAIITEPKIIFLDEPTLGLDVLARRELWKIITNLKTKSTIILTTHYMEEAEVLADRIAIMQKGNIVDIDTPSNFVSKTNSKNFEDAFVKIVNGEI